MKFGSLWKQKKKKTPEIGETDLAQGLKRMSFRLVLDAAQRVEVRTVD